MVKRTAVVGPFQNIRSTAINDAANVEPFLKELPRINIPNLWYSSVIQAGVEKIQVVESQLITEKQVINSTLSKRISYINDSDLLPIFAVVTESLEMLVENAKYKKHSKESGSLSRFLIDFLIAAHRKQNLILFKKKSLT